MRPLFCSALLLCFAAANAANELEQYLPRGSAARAGRLAALNKALDDDRLARALGVWREKLEKLASEEVKLTDFLLSLVERDRLFKGDELDRDRARALARRTEQIDRATLNAWMQALHGRLGPHTTRMGTLLFLAEQDRLFTRDKLNKDASDRLRARVGLLPKEAVNELARAAGIGAGPAAFALLQVDSLYTGGAFQKATFAKLLAPFKKK